MDSQIYAMLEGFTPDQRKAFAGVSPAVSKEFEVEYAANAAKRAAAAAAAALAVKVDTCKARVLSVLQEGFVTLPADSSLQFRLTTLENGSVVWVPGKVVVPGVNGKAGQDNGGPDKRSKAVEVDGILHPSMSAALTAHNYAGSKVAFAGGQSWLLSHGHAVKVPVTA